MAKFKAPNGLYQFRKSLNLCVGCGQGKDTSTVICSNCKRIRNNRRKRLREAKTQSGYWIGET